MGKVYDYPDLRLHKQDAWVRLRDKGEKKTLAFKQRLGAGEGGNDLGMREVELEVSDVDKAAEFLERIGLVRRFYEEKRRVHFVLEGVEVNLDTWPLMPTYLKIEGRNWDVVREAVQKLGLDWSRRVVFPAMQIYAKYGINEMDYEVLTFGEQKKRVD